MAFDVVVVGGGIGGLTVAALLAARGLNTCLCERQSQVGGCIARVEFGGRQFEPGMGLYTSFGAGEIYETVFSELPVNIPSTTLLSEPYVVRLPDGNDIRLTKDDSFLAALGEVFPECANEAIAFYKLSSQTGSRLSFQEPALKYLDQSSPRFQAFIEAQLRAFLHTSLERCSIGATAAALAWPRRELYSVAGGIATLPETLAESIKQSGGTVRLNTSVLRLAYDQTGQPLGVDLLSGERVIARKAVISNLTVWDTYGKMVGLNRTPAENKKLLNTLHGSGAYLIYANIEDSAVKRLPGERLLAVTPETNGAFAEFTLAVQAETATLKSMTEVDQWFAYHTSEEDFEESDQAALEQFWTKLHAALPELGAGIEVIETANPRTFYDQTRRKLGMVMGFEQTPHPFNPTTRTIFPNVFSIGDTVSHGATLDRVVETALSLANDLIKK